MTFLEPLPRTTVLLLEQQLENFLVKYDKMSLERVIGNLEAEEELERNIAEVTCQLHSLISIEDAQDDSTDYNGDAPLFESVLADDHGTEHRSDDDVLFLHGILAECDTRDLLLDNVSVFEFQGMREEAKSGDISVTPSTTLMPKNPNRPTSLFRDMEKRMPASNGTFRNASNGTFQVLSPKMWYHGNVLVVVPAPPGRLQSIVPVE